MSSLRVIMIQNDPSVRQNASLASASNPVNLSISNIQTSPSNTILPSIYSQPDLSATANTYSATSSSKKGETLSEHSSPLKITPIVEQALLQAVNGHINRLNSPTSIDVNSVPKELPSSPSSPVLSNSKLQQIDSYYVDFNQTESNAFSKDYANYIRTTKYTAFSFIPLNIFGQFRRWSNIYFLIGAIFSLVGDSTVSPFAQIAPLLFVLLVTAIKDGHEDLQRYKADKIANKQPATIIRDGKHLIVETQHLKPGDIVALQKGNKVPADIYLLSTSYEDGLCFIETSELDGETSLKRRNALPETVNFTQPEQLNKFNGRIECELPNENLGKFEGRLITKCFDGTEVVLPLTMSQLLLRGSYLRNTEFAYGVIVYAGVETKIFKNLKRTGLKYSTMENILNRIILFAFMYNVIMLIASVILKGQLTSIMRWGVWYMKPTSDAFGADDYFSSFMTYFIIYSYTIPISLFVIIELVRVLQRQFMVWDIQFLSPKGQTMRVNNSNLNEDLGSVHHVFSDKTGTLTRNEMRLTHLCSGSLSFPVQNLLNSLTHEGVQDLARCILLCNSATRVEENDPISTGQRITPHVDYESQSPDEIALLRGIQLYGVIKQRRKKSVLVLESGIEREYEVLEVMDFDSDRKRMSVIVRNPEGHIVVYSKGADNIMMPRLNEKSNTDPRLQCVNAQIHDFSHVGLRTLVFAKKNMSEECYAEFRRHYDEAARSLNERDAKLNATIDCVETGFELLGCSAIEDRLQDQVPETIEFLLRCGIKVWMLTGDKQETAINIAHSCKLLNHDMVLMELNGSSVKRVKKQIDTFTALINSSKSQDQFGLSITGESMNIIMESYSNELMGLCNRSASIICCRMTPLQKALVVRMVKEKEKVITLSIGDGANDVSMIQEADIGVGIEGMEGAQAVRASDYAFGEFKCLARLLSVHGRFSVLRLSNLVFYSFYKNISFITTQFYFGVNSMWSGQGLYNGSFLPMWNVLFTSLPPLIYACMEKDMSEQVLSRFPQLYKVTRDRSYMWSWRRCISWGLSCVWHTIVSISACLLIWSDGPADQPDGTTSDFETFQWFNAVVILGIVTLRMGLISKYWTWFVVAGVVASFIMYIIVLGGLEVITTINSSIKGAPAQDDVPLGTIKNLHGISAYWFVILLAPIAAVLPDVVAYYFKVQEYPDDADILREWGIIEYERNLTKSKPNQGNEFRTRTKSNTINVPNLSKTGIMKKPS